MFKRILERVTGQVLPEATDVGGDVLETEPQSQLGAGIKEQKSFARCSRFVHHNAEVSKKPIADVLRSAIDNRLDFINAMADWRDPGPADGNQPAGAGNLSYNGPPEGTRMDGLPVWGEDHPWWHTNWEKMRSGDGLKTGFVVFVKENPKPIGNVPENIQRLAVEKFARIYEGKKFPMSFDWQTPDGPPEDLGAEISTELRAIRTDLVGQKQHDAQLFDMAVKNLMQKGSINSKIPAQMGLDECRVVLEEIDALKGLRGF